MSKPEDIPQDVWLAAFNAFNAARDPEATQEVTARAILAERERCAKIAGSHVPLHLRDDGDRLVSRTAANIAAAIRAGGQ